MLAPCLMKTHHICKCDPESEGHLWWSHNWHWSMEMIYTHCPKTKQISVRTLSTLLDCTQYCCLSISVLKFSAHQRKDIFHWNKTKTKKTESHWEIIFIPEMQSIHNKEVIMSLSAHQKIIVTKIKQKTVVSKKAKLEF